MGLLGAFRNWRSRRFGTWTLDDPRPIAADAPYTFYLPHAVLVDAVEPGDLIRAIFRAHPPSRQFGAERMWVEVTAVDGDHFVGQLMNDPADMPQLRWGDEVRIPRSHLIDVRYAEGKVGPEEPAQRWYWERCMVDACVLQGRSRVDYIYREEPRMGKSEDTFPDSGWRIRGTDAGIAEDARLDEGPSYVAIAAVLNEDDRWLRLIDEPVGSAFVWSEPDRAFITAD